MLVALRSGPDGAYRRVQMALGPADEPDAERYLSMYRLEELRPPPDDASLAREAFDAGDYAGLLHCGSFNRAASELLLIA